MGTMGSPVEMWVILEPRPSWLIAAHESPPEWEGGGRRHKFRVTSPGGGGIKCEGHPQGGKGGRYQV